MESESKIPPTIIKNDSGKTFLTMQQKRQMVVQSYSNMGKNITQKLSKEMNATCLQFGM